MEEQPNEKIEQTAVHSGAAQTNVANAQANQIQMQMEEQDKNLAEAQLDCNETLTKIYHNLRQDYLKTNADGILDWESLKDKKKRVFTDEGVDKIMQIIGGYINKETLLSNFDTEQINRRMLKFNLALSGLLFMKYEILFRVPTLEECKEILELRIAERIKRKRITLEILGKEQDEKELEKEVFEELNYNIEKELIKIKDETKKINLREFEMIFTMIEAIVEATHNRAWKGEERGSLRRHFNISEVIGGRQTPQEKKGMFGMFK